MTKMLRLVLFFWTLACFVHASDLADVKNTHQGNEKHSETIRSNTADKVMDDVNLNVDDVMKRGQILGMGGRCGWYNEKCSGLTTHCCDPWRCQYKKWYHRLSKTGGRCL